MLVALGEEIIAWSKERPAWQREVMRRIAAGDSLSDVDYDSLVEDVVSGKPFVEPEFGLGQLPHIAADDLPVRLLSIEKPEHVNALESREPLTFAPAGLTIVYGDNASGKSGYARLLKRITRARHREDVLSDVFRDTSLSRPSAVLSVQIGEATVSITWPESPRPELQRMLFYDASCGGAYIINESDFPYRPSALFVMDGLIEACMAIRTRIDARLVKNGASITDVPRVGEQVQGTDAGRFLTSLSGSSDIAVLDALIATFDGSTVTVDEVRAQEARLRSMDTRKEGRLLSRQREKLDALSQHLENLDTFLGKDGLAALQQGRDSLKTLEDAALVLSRTFESQPLHGVGSSSWKTLWESARRYSEEQAYSGDAFPVLGEHCRCVLCQQSLDEQARDRFARFEAFVKDDTQVRLQEARRSYDRQLESLADLVVSPEVIKNNLQDLEATHRDIVARIRDLLTKFEILRERTRDALSEWAVIPPVGVDLGTILVDLKEASTATTATAEGLSNPEGIQTQLATLAARRAELELLGQVKNSRLTIVKEIARLKEREALEAAKSAAATTGITKKILELSEESITEVVRDTFTRETERLRLERVTITRTRADKGALLHQPKLVGTRQQVTLPRVFSEGERTALGLAAFFTEALLDPSNSALILDDPVTSLDHIRRGLVAARLATLAEGRQVVVFTHDVAFVADLKREASGREVAVAERSVMRSRADERKPGSCSTTHPWKAKDVPARLDELQWDLARIKRESDGWDQKAYEEAVAIWAGNLSETWERIFSQEIVGPVIAEGGLEVRPMMVKILVRFSEQDRAEFEASYSRVSQWAKRHDKSALVNYVAPDILLLESEVKQVEAWFKRVKSYKS
jgi:hypothetical protein